MTAARIVLVGQDTFIRSGISAILNGEPSFAVVAETADPAQAARLGERLRPSLFVVDAPTLRADAFELIRRLGTASVAERIPVLLLVADASQLDVDALRLGGCAIARQHAAAAELVSAVRLVAAGYLPIARSLAERLAHAMSRIDRGIGETAIRHRLTPREREVFHLIIQGLSNAEIAAALTVASSTVKSHVQDILNKLGLRNRVEAVICAYQSIGATLPAATRPATP